MEPRKPRAHVAAPITALSLAGGAAVAFGLGDAIGFLSDAAEDVFILTWLLGWVLLAWAVIAGGGSAVLLGLRWRSRQKASRLEAALVAASLTLITVVLVSHPLWGTGSAVGA